MDNNSLPVLPFLHSDGETRYLGPLHSGDEPFMLAKNLDGVAVLVDKHRIKSGIFAIDHLGCDTQMCIRDSHVGDGHLLPVKFGWPALPLEAPLTFRIQRESGTDQSLSLIHI